MELSRCPLFLGEKLTVEDLIEYVALLVGNGNARLLGDSAPTQTSSAVSGSVTVDMGAAGASARPKPSMPPAIRRILNSKACRGAIMFGDVLSYAECRQLLQSLAACSNPFQCAHGRPSAVPLLLLPHG